jgi:uncharacterized membrane protein YgcG
MKTLLLTALFAVTTLAQGQNCSPVISDEAGILNDAASANEIAKGIAPLIDEGADVKIVTVKPLWKYGSNLQAVEDAYEHACSGWTAPNGKRKANLFVMVVAPAEHKKNVFFGAAYSPVLPSEDIVNTIYSHAANPYFKNQQWSQGFAAAARDFAAKVVAYHDQQQHPVASTTTTTTVVQPTDYKGLWTFLMWLLFAGLAAVCCFGLIRLLGQRRRSKEEIAGAKADALSEWNQANAAYTAMSKTDPRYERISRQFRDMSNSLGYDPNEPNTAAGYRAIERAWGDLRRTINVTPGAGVPAKATTAKAPPEPPPAQAKRHTEHKATHRVPDQPAPAPVKNETVVVRDSGSNLDGFASGVLVDEALRGERYREPDPPRYREPEPEREPERTSSGSDSSWSKDDDEPSGGSGSDSSWSDPGGGGGGGGSGSDSGF